MNMQSGLYPSLTLPVDTQDGIFLDTKKARSLGEDLAGEYCFAEPYPHIVLDNFFPEPFLDQILKNFPAQNLNDDVLYEDDYAGKHKRQVYPESCNGYIRQVFNFLNSAPILQFLEGLTSIDGLVADPYFHGAGFHETSTGGKLGIHADFRINEVLHLNRRLNLLIYLNKDWQESYGGYLELWDRKMTKKCASVAPIFNRCVIFSTDADSYHGHPDPMTTPPHIKRRSIAMYYYTASRRVYEDTPSTNTKYAARSHDSLETKRQILVTDVMNSLKDWLPPIILRQLRKLR